jgi:small-conductance mechanosensitive channel
VISNFSFEPKPVRVRVRFQVDYDVDLQEAEKISIGAIESCAGVIAGSAQIVVRSLWDETGGHLLSGVLLEARYRIHEVRERTAIRSKVLTAILDGFKKNGINMAYPRVVLHTGSATLRS